MVEDELAFRFDEFYVLPIEFCGDVGLKVFVDLGEFFGDVDPVHEIPPGKCSVPRSISRSNSNRK
jgi:hypothetical protein